jgi:diguanylate cyclase (GGDEF)-like protein
LQKQQSRKASGLSREETERAQLSEQRSGPSLARAMTLACVLGGAAVWVYVRYLSPLQPVGHEKWALWPVTAVGLWAGERSLVSVRNRRVSIEVSLSEIPVLLGIVFLRPLLALSAVSCGYLASLAHRRKKVTSVLPSWTAYLLAVSLGILAYDHWLGPGGSAVHARGWLVSGATILLITVVDLVLVVVGVGVIEKHWRWPPLAQMLPQTVAYIAVCTAGGLVAVSLVAVNTWAIALLAAIAVAANLAYRATVVSSQRYANLEKLYDFTRRLSGVGGGREVMATVVEDTRTILTAGRAELAIPVGSNIRGLVIRCSLKDEGVARFQEGAPLSRLDKLVGQRGAMLFNARCDDPELAAAMGEQGLTEALVAPLNRDDLAAGYLLVANRPFQHEGFKPADLRFFETLAANAGVALRSSELMEELRREVDRRAHQANHDPLTGLPNRLLFSQRLDEALAASPDSKVTVMLIDLDGFKDVNDTLGHVTGDAILVEIGRRLMPLGNAQSTVARLGGDEFAVLVTASDDLDVETTADRVLSLVTQPCAVESLLLDIRASMGVAVAPGDAEGRDGTKLMRHADVAMYLAKASGGGVRFYDPAEDHSTLRRLTLATELRRALERDDLEVWYQPVVELGSGEVMGCEALLRWSHVQFGSISPVEFIPVAEHAGLIDPLTWFVLDRALSQLKEWRLLVPRLTVAVNLSARSLGSAKVPERVAEALGRAGIPAEALTLELTESLMESDPTTCERAMHNLKELGVNLSIDDYGTGYSSLSRLKLLPFKDLKIDRSFVKEMINNQGDEAIVRSTIELARSLGRRTTAEGVEDQATLHRLTSLGCDAAQGYYLARPLPARECETWLKAFVRRPSLAAAAAVASGPDRRDLAWQLNV